MNIQKLTFALLASLCLGNAMAQKHSLVTLVEATELSPSNIIFPQSVNGMMTFKPCADDCDEEYKRARLTANTTFSVNGRGVSFSDFGKDFAAIRVSKDGYALVSVDTQTNTIVSIHIEG
jgi:hypothetical protein